MGIHEVKSYLRNPQTTCEISQTLLSVRISMAFFRSKSLIFRWNSCNVSRTAARLVELICWQRKVFFCKTSHFSKMATVVSTSGRFSITSSIPVSWPALATYMYMYIYISIHVYIYINMYVYMIFYDIVILINGFPQKKQLMCSDNENQDIPHGASFMSANWSLPPQRLLKMSYRQRRKSSRNGEIICDHLWLYHFQDQQAKSTKPRKSGPKCQVLSLTRHRRDPSPIFRCVQLRKALSSCNVTTLGTATEPIS